MNAKFVNYIFAALILLVCGSVPAFSQNQCNLQIYVYEFKEDGSSEQFPVRDAKIKLVDTKTRKSLKVSQDTGAPTVADINAGDYEIAVSENGFQQTLDNFSVDCSLVNAENTVSKIVFLWKGSAQQTFNVSAKSKGTNGQLYKAQGEAPINSGAVFLGKPEYPKAARAVGATGKVEVQVTINELGYVISAQAVSGHPLLRSAAVKAAKESKFRMTFLEGIPVKVTGIIVYNFVP
jgi:TonB family protein